MQSAPPTSCIPFIEQKTLDEWATQIPFKPLRPVQISKLPINTGDFSRNKVCTITCAALVFLIKKNRVVEPEAHRMPGAPFIGMLLADEWESTIA